MQSQSANDKLLEEPETIISVNDRLNTYLKACLGYLRKELKTQHFLSIITFAEESR